MRRMRAGWDQFEAAAGLVAVFFLAFGPLTCAIMAAIFSFFLGEWQALAIAACVIVPTLPMAVWLTRMAALAMDRFQVDQAGETQIDQRQPRSGRRLSFALLLADGLPVIPVALRLPLAVWWIAHFAAGLLIENADMLSDEKWLFGDINEGTFAVVLAWLFHFAANVFLILALRTLLPTSRIPERVWRYRFVVATAMVSPLMAQGFG